MALAVFVGIAVSHPLILLIFNESISEEIAATQAGQIDDLKRLGEERKAGIPPVPPVSATTAASAELQQKIDLSACLGRLQTAEQSGSAISLPCGNSSPRATCGPRCNVIGEQKAQVDREIARLREEVKSSNDVQRADFEKAVANRQAIIDRIDSETAAATEALGKTFSQDYLARVRALSRLEEREPTVRVVKWFLLIFFIVVDILPVTMKLATPPGEYEDIRDKRLELSGLRENINREAARADIPSQVRIAVLLRGLDTMTKTWSTFLKKFSHANETFEDSADDLHNPGAGNGANGSSHRVVDEMRDTNNEMWNEWRQRMKEDLGPRHE